MKLLSNSGFSVIYVFFLISIIFIFWIAVLNKENFINKIIQYHQIEDEMTQKIIQDTQEIFSFYENNWNQLYIPILSCPNLVSYYSWNVLIWTWYTTLTESFCKWNIWDNDLELYYSWDYLNFSSWKLANIQIPFISQSELFFTWIIDDTYKIDFEHPTIDDQFVIQRIKKTSKFQYTNMWENIFWSNSKVKNIIEKNINNTMPFLKLWEVSDASLYFDIEGWFYWKIIEFDKNIFDSWQKLVKKNEFNFWNLETASWFLKWDGTFSSLISDAKKFDFISKDYAIFLLSKSWDIEKKQYTFQIFGNNKTPIYMIPLQDDSEKVTYFANDILMKAGDYYSKIYKIIYYK